MPVIVLLACLLTTALYVWKGDVSKQAKLVMFVIYVGSWIFLLLPRINRALNLGMDGPFPLVRDLMPTEVIQTFGLLVQIGMCVYYGGHFRKAEREILGEKGKPEEKE